MKTALHSLTTLTRFGNDDHTDTTSHITSNEERSNFILKGEGRAHRNATPLM
jgi:hypothetical protein